MGPHTFYMEPPIHAWCAQYSYEHTVHDLLSRTCTGTVQLYYRLYRYEYCTAVEQIDIRYGILWAAEFVLWA